MGKLFVGGNFDIRFAKKVCTFWVADDQSLFRSQ